VRLPAPGVKRSSIHGPISTATVNSPGTASSCQTWPSQRRLCAGTRQSDTAKASIVSATAVASIIRPAERGGSRPISQPAIAAAPASASKLTATRHAPKRCSET
jgi:hypothetical protein